MSKRLQHWSRYYWVIMIKSSFLFQRFGGWQSPLTRWNANILRPVVIFKCEVAFKSITMEDQYFHYTLASWMVILGKFWGSVEKNPRLYWFEFPLHCDWSGKFSTTFKPNTCCICFFSNLDSFLRSSLFFTLSSPPRRCHILLCSFKM